MLPRLERLGMRIIAVLTATYIEVVHLDGDLIHSLMRILQIDRSLLGHTFLTILIC